MRLYLDVCCINRPFDDQSQEKVRLETEAVERIIDAVSTGQLRWVSSVAVEFEARKCQDTTRRSALLVLLELAAETQTPDSAALARVEVFAGAGLRGIDAVHVALAECAGCDVFLTTDENLQHWVERFSGTLRIPVRNPVEWAKEMLDR